MRLARVGLGSGVGLSGYNLYASIPGQVRVQFSFPETPDNYRYHMIPRRDCRNRSPKNPSAATAKEGTVSKYFVNIGSRKRAV